VLAIERADAEVRRHAFGGESRPDFPDILKRTRLLAHDARSSLL